MKRITAAILLFTLIFAMLAAPASAAGAETPSGSAYADIGAEIEAYVAEVSRIGRHKQHRSRRADKGYKKHYFLFYKGEYLLHNGISLRFFYKIQFRLHRIAQTPPRMQYPQNKADADFSASALLINRNLLFCLYATGDSIASSTILSMHMRCFSVMRIPLTAPIEMLSTVFGSLKGSVPGFIWNSVV